MQNWSYVAKVTTLRARVSQGRLFILDNLPTERYNGYKNGY